LVQVVRENPQLFSSSASQTETTSWSGLPIIFDETFTETYRIGRMSSASLINVYPDISLHTEGVASKHCVLLTSEGIYESSSLAGKEPNIETSALSAEDMSGRWDRLKSEWAQDSHADQRKGNWSLWSQEFIQQISMNEAVRNTMAMGSVLSITMRAEDTGK
jgi:dethiobiotin synthetase/adenosylmethionine--8-amino-7-oxononanoate aminotransferase